MATTARLGQSSGPSDATTAQDRDIVDQYLREVGGFSLMTADEEIALGRAIRAGDESAVQELVSRNLRFVISVAKKYQHRGVPLSDLIGEGNVGLVLAARRFDPDQGARFITYAVWWIRQAIASAVARQSSIVRIPSTQTARRRRLVRAADAVRQELGREPTSREIAESSGLPVEEIRSTIRVAASDVSLDAPIGEDADETLLDLLGDGAEEADADRDIAAKSAKAQIERALGTLSARDARILRLHFGLEDGRERTLDEIGALLGVTRERVRQLRDRSLRRLRAGASAPRRADSGKPVLAHPPARSYILRNPVYKKSDLTPRPRTVEAKDDEVAALAWRD